MKPFRSYYSTVVEHIDYRTETADCTCLRCRNVDPAVIRRSIAGDVLWSLRLFRRHPSIPLFFLGLAVLDIVLHALSRRVGLSVGPLEAPLPWLAFLLAFPVVFRGYVVAIATGELVGDGRSAGDAIAESLRRAPAVAAATVGTLVVALSAFVAAMTLLVALFGGAYALDLVLGLGVVDPSVFDGPAFDGIAPTLAFGSVVALAAFKCWLAPDICVVGGCGPLAALRTSWRVTASHRRRLTAVVVGFVVTTAASERLGGARPAGPLHETIPAAEPAIDVLLTAGLLLSYAIWFAVGAQIYARAAVER